MPTSILFLLGLLVAFIGEALHLPPGFRAAAYGDLINMTSFQVNIKPPEQTTNRIQRDLDGIMSFERLKAQSENERFAFDKAKMIHEEKQKIRDIVASEGGASSFWVSSG
mmetsp:Transcript_65458/g.128706  ORF Transcript_65458/g.128706 Transcript_65458/m.128706 type:complete len:110 (+) Transcript_65458:57-386(+)